MSTDTRTDTVRTARLDVGSSFIEVRPGTGGHVLLAVHERQPDQAENNDITLNVSARVGQATVRALRLAARLAAGTDTGCTGHPLWCDPYNHLANGLPCNASVGEFHFGRQTLEVVLYRRAPDTATVVGLYAGHEHGPDAVVDLPPPAAVELARALWVLEQPDMPWVPVGAP